MAKWFDLAKTIEFPKETHKIITLEGIPIVIFNLDGEYYAIENRCTHEDFPLDNGERVGSTLSCPLHGAKFCIKTGRVLSAPAFIDVVTFPTRVENGMVQVQV